MAIQEVKVTFNKHDRDILISIDTSLKELVKIERAKRDCYAEELEHKAAENDQN